MTEIAPWKKKKKAQIVYGGERPGANQTQPARKQATSTKTGKPSTPVLFRKTSTCYGSIQNLNIDYLDERSETKSRSEGKLIQGIGYLSKEEVGQVHAGGFLHSRLVDMHQENEPGPIGLDNQIRKQRILKAWSSHLIRHNKDADTSKKMKVGHKVIFSLDKKFQRKLEKKGINTDVVVQSIMRDALRKFAETYHPGDRIGYAYGIHHDTDNLHVHTFIHAKTEKGKVVGISSALKNSKQNTSQADKIGRIKQTVNRHALKWEKLASDKEAFRTFSKVSRNQKYFYAPKIAVEDPQLEQARRKLVSIERRMKRRVEAPESAAPRQALRFRRARNFYNRLKRTLELNHGRKTQHPALQKTSRQAQIKQRRRLS